MPALSIIWRTVGLLLATSVDSVLEVLPPVSCRPMPAVPDWVRGLFVYRSNLIPLVDAARLLDTPHADDRMSNRVLVIRVCGDHAVHDWPVGLWVEHVLGLDRIDFDTAGTHPGLSTEKGRFLGPVAQTPWGQVQLIRPDEMFTSEQAAVLTQRLAEASKTSAGFGKSAGAA